MNDKYLMDVRENIEYAKRNIVDLIYKASRLEGISVTFPDTNEIYEGRPVSNLSVEDIVKVNNLKTAWKFVFDTIEYPCDMRYIRQINQYVQAGLNSSPGMLRNVPVSIGGTSWRPDIPQEAKCEREISEILDINNCTEKAIKMMEYIMRSQMFIDGNKRTAQLVANQIMIQGGRGIIAVPVEKHSQFFTHLIKYYETNNDKELFEFIYDEAIDGYNRPSEA